MASQVNNIGTTAIIVFLFTLLFTGLYFVTGDITENNTKLDTKSVQVIQSLGAEYSNNINTTSFVTDSGQYNDSTFDDVDPFVRQYLEEKTEVEQKKSLINTVLLYPSFLLSMFGVENMVILTTFSGLVYGLIVFLLGLQIYKAIGKEVD